MLGFRLVAAGPSRLPWTGRSVHTCVVRYAVPAKPQPKSPFAAVTRKSKPTRTQRSTTPVSAGSSETPSLPSNSSTAEKGSAPLTFDFSDDIETPTKVVRNTTRPPPQTDIITAPQTESTIASTTSKASQFARHLGALLVPTSTPPLPSGPHEAIIFKTATPDTTPSEPLPDWNFQPIPDRPGEVERIIYSRAYGANPRAILWFWGTGILFVFLRWNSPTDEEYKELINRGTSDEAVLNEAEDKKMKLLGPFKYLVKYGDVLLTTFSLIGLTGLVLYTYGQSRVVTKLSQVKMNGGREVIRMTNGFHGVIPGLPRFKTYQKDAVSVRFLPINRARSAFLSFDIAGQNEKFWMKPYRLNFGNDAELDKLPGNVIMSFARLEEALGPIKE